MAPISNTGSARLLITLLLTVLFCGCFRSSSSELPEVVWGTHGMSNGRFDRPRAVAIDNHDELYIADKTGRIQVFNTDGKYLRGWRTPETAHGLPCGLSIDRDGNLLVADTHYFRMLVYAPSGELQGGRTIGGRQGNSPGEFNFVTDAAVDSKGNYYISEYGQFDRVQKFTRDGQFLTQWGSHGSEPGQFIQPRCLLMDAGDQLWVADACNHRIQIFDVSGPSPRLVRLWGRCGTALGEIRYPYGLAFDGKGCVYVCEFGNSRVQKFTLDGRYVAAWGKPGRRPGELNQPWSLVCDSRGRLFVLDTYNHRVQRCRF